ncbi:hypothetical protein CANCADRAFT_4512 [Tortispora caseinolytica NRRL Y-17796]|uniref:Carbohydrate kinase PfkB domain-containing protein n=1 Tax=Tortispora caseinolytica NRRL Y-17796 TaxID=767744 RepID=A0A1E4T9C4_9ASCO|nr:hypothetical protein CANCADRAFT_4512 [Tortispora caseinolytica NRRL Y-17796]
MARDRILLVGAAYQDIILDVPHFPQEDTKLQVRNLVRRWGGNVVNIARVLRALDDNLDIHLVVPLPSESTSKEFLEFCARINVTVSPLFSDATEFPVAYVTRSLDRNTRTILNYSNVPQFDQTTIQHVLDLISSHEYSWLHFEGRTPEFLEKCLDAPEIASKVNVSLELEKPDRLWLLPLASKVSTVFSNCEFLRKVHRPDWNADFRERCLSFLNSGVSPNCFITSGSSVTFGSVAGDPVFMPIEKVSSKESTGAGDSFAAACIYYLMRNAGGTEETVRFANLVAYQFLESKDNDISSSSGSSDTLNSERMPIPCDFAERLRN